MVSLIVLVLRILKTQNPQERKEKTDSLGLKIKEYIDINYTRDIPLNEIANRLYISPYYLSHIFKEETGYSPISYDPAANRGSKETIVSHTTVCLGNFRPRRLSKRQLFQHLIQKSFGALPERFQKSLPYGKLMRSLVHGVGVSMETRDPRYCDQL